ncbi:MAG TPA: hypothetical protein VN873_12645 [Candidatus Angelobacter sp.]|nr:hypothetical protein [Candidatus Angelobacter sp.]
MPAIAAALIAGVILLIVPHASPWEGLTTFNPAFMGRVPPPAWNLGIILIVLIHLALSVIYGFIISIAVLNIHELRAVFVGGVVGLILYLVNLGVVSLWFPALRGNEVSVIITHGVFGLIAAGLYRGLLRRRIPAESQNPTPPPAPPAA